MKQIIILIFIAFLSSHNSIGQVGDLKHGDKVYSVVNHVFGNHSKQVLLNKYFYNNRGWLVLLSDSDFFDNIYGQCLDFDKEKVIQLNKIISKSDYNSILSQSRNFQPFEKIIKSKLHKNIRLVGNRHKVDVIKMTKPIFFSDKAILYLHRNEEEKILIFKMNDDGNWKLICDKYLYLRLSD